jgi:hypothetical protein
LVSATAFVLTSRPERYVKQLVSHFGNKSEAIFHAASGGDMAKVLRQVPFAETLTLTLPWSLTNEDNRRHG